MKYYLKIAAASVFCLSIFFSAGAQQKKKKKTSTENEIQEPIPPPPPAEELKISTIDTSQISESEKRNYEIPEPQIDFDTTAAPNDAFTQDILQLLEVTNAMNLGQMFASNIADADEQNELLKEFYKRFLKDFKEGSSFRWMQNVYIKAYRQNYTREEIKELIKFYQTPLGKKLIKSTVEMLPSVMDQGKKIGKYKGTQIMREILNEQSKN